MALLEEWLARLFEESASRKQMAAFALALLPLLAEAVFTFTTCMAYLLKRPSASAIPSSIKSILVINLLLTLLLLCATLAEGVIVTGNLFPPMRDYTYFGSHFASLSLAPATAPVSRLSAMLEILRKYQIVATQENERRGTNPLVDLLRHTPLDLLAMALTWMVVVAYVAVVARTGLRVASCGGEGMGEKSSWSFKAIQRMMQVADRSKWVALCFAVVFAMWTCFSGIARSMSIWEYPYVQEHGWDGAKVLTMLLKSMRSERVWRWTAASSTFILLAVASLYTIAARVALYACCKHFSLRQQAEPLISVA